MSRQAKLLSTAKPLCQTRSRHLSPPRSNRECNNDGNYLELSAPVRPVCPYSVGLCAAEHSPRGNTTADLV